jgi:hypothetical protein
MPAAFDNRRSDMKKLAAALLVFVGTSAALAQKPPAQVEFNKASPAGGNKSVAASGTYTIDDGWKPVSAKLLLIPRGGGHQQEVTTTDLTAGKWGPISIKDLSAGEYTAYVWFVVHHEKQGDVIIASRVVAVKVP